MRACRSAEGGGRLGYQPAVHPRLTGDLRVEGDAEDSTLARGHDPAVLKGGNGASQRANLHDLRGTNEDGLDGA